ncbi:MAG: trypsin-like peptidase domain-containing protein, partial [Myxococcota bacterium]
DRPRSFEGKNRSNSEATGFVVDAEQGLVLTNRHVVTAAPVVARGSFRNREEVDLVPVYRDPVHDFGLFRYDPDQVKFHRPASLDLRPDKAKEGLAIRVIGNDSGEQLSILDGTIARLDRDAPNYGPSYNDFNTFYLQAAAGISGGSSGSPVVDIRGDVVGLNAGAASGARASSFFLPLPRVKRAVELIRKGQPVSRGTLQTTWNYVGYDELRRLGLPEEVEAVARRQRPNGLGLLVLRDVLAKGPASDLLEVGDILISVDDTPIHDFVTLEALLDDKVGDAVTVTVNRRGKAITVSPTVGDLHQIVPNAYVTIGGAVLHNLSYHQARLVQTPVEGVFVADNGFSFERDGIPRRAILVSANGVTLPDLGAFTKVLADVAHGESVRFKWYPQGRPQERRVSAVRLDRQWFEARHCIRNDATGEWPCTNLETQAQAPGSTFGPEATDLERPPVSDKRGKRLQSSLIGIECDVPYQVAGLPGDNFVGGGLVVDDEEGLVIVDRNTVPIAVAELSAILFGTVRVPASLVALHPRHNLAVLRIDPAILKRFGLKAAEFATTPAKPGDKLWMVELEDQGAIDVRTTEFRDTDALVLGAAGAPRFRQTHLDTWVTDPRPSHNGVIVDRKGRVVAFQASFSFNSGREANEIWRTMPATLVQEAIDLAKGRPGTDIGWELVPIDLPTALQQGLPGGTARQLTRHDPERRQVLMVRRTMRGTQAANEFEPGDLVVAVNGKPVTRFEDIERAVGNRSTASIEVIREGRSESIAVASDLLEPLDITEVLLWAGLRIHDPHRAARFAGADPERPYIAWWNGGSPAGRAKVYPQRSILDINGIDTPDLDTLVEVLAALPPGEPVRLRLAQLSGEEQVLTLQPEENFWPTVLLSYQDGGWTREVLGRAPASAARE